MKHKISRIALSIALCVIICAVLYVSNVWIATAIVAMATIDALRLLWKYGRAWWAKRHSQVAQRERSLLFLVSVMWFFLCTGTALYLWAFSCESIEHKDGSFLFINAEYLLRSLVCSFQLFTGSIDSNVLDGVSNHQYIKGLISLQAVASFLCTITVLLSLAYARLKAYYKLHRQTTINNQHNHLYVFWGMNTPSCMLSSSILTKDKKALLLFVENNNIDEERQSGWNNIVSIFTHRRQTFAEAEKLGARVTFTESRLCDVDIESIENGDVLTEINLRKLKCLISDLTKYELDAQLHVFFMSENEEENIRAISTLATDLTINTIKTTKVKQRFYCHARRNGFNQIVEDIAFKQGLDVRIVDSSYLAVELLKADENNHPVRFVETDSQNPTTVKSAFNSLIIGFDEVGRDALKFLYEFGAFVDCNSKPGWERRSPFHCVVIDKRMEELAGAFGNFAPSVMRQKGYDGTTPLVELKTCDCQNQEFYEKILSTQFCEVLNYIVIAVGDDELGMTIAVRILNHIRRVRADLTRLKIFVRSYNPNKESFMDKIASHYNEGYNNGVEDCAFQTDSIIKLFGQSNNIYSYDMVVNEELTRKGRNYQESYARLRGESELWDARRKKAQEKASLDSLRSLRRKELQDLSNALHADTKIYLLKDAIQKLKSEDYDWEGFLDRYFDGDNMPINDGEYDKINYTLLDDIENRIILNLARLEHMRWNASHEMLGYVKARKGLHSCDERTREHNCLRPWHELDEESRATLNSAWPCDYKLFDFSVVDNSIFLNKDKLL